MKIKVNLLLIIGRNEHWFFRSKVILIIKTVCIDISTSHRGRRYMHRFFLRIDTSPPHSESDPIGFIPPPPSVLRNDSLPRRTRRSRCLAVVCKIVNSCRPCGLCQIDLAGGYSTWACWACSSGLWYGRLTELFGKDCLCGESNRTEYIHVTYSRVRRRPTPGV